jgi:hypothetical protein
MSGVDGHVAKAQWAMANRGRSRYGYPVSPMTTFLGLLCLGIVFGFLVPLFSHAGGKSSNQAMKRCG